MKYQLLFVMGSTWEIDEEKTMRIVKTLGFSDKLIINGIPQQCMRNIAAGYFTGDSEFEVLTDIKTVVKNALAPEIGSVVEFIIIVLDSATYGLYMVKDPLY